MATSTLEEAIKTLEVVLVHQEVEVARGKLLVGTLLIRHWGGGSRPHKLVGFIERFKGASEKSKISGELSKYETCISDD